MARRKDIYIQNVPESTKSLLYKLAYQNGYSLQAYVKMVLNNHLHQKFPDKFIE